jgi:hypothetical protein
MISKMLLPRRLVDWSPNGLYCLVFCFLIGVKLVLQPNVINRIPHPTTTTKSWARIDKSARIDAAVIAIKRGEFTDFVNTAKKYNY